jgi:uncharacterized protein YqgC (DUF456 family)
MTPFAALGPWLGYGLWALVLLVASLLVYLGLGGNFVLLGLALVHALVTGFDPIGWPLLLVLLGIALLGELVEFLLGTFYVLRKGAGGGAAVGGFIGGLVGGVAGHAVIPVIGAVLGSFAGGFAGAVLGELRRQRRLEPSLRAGTHAFIGRMLAILVKHAFGLVMVFLILRATWPGR